jgi:hypothetical protein
MKTKTLLAVLGVAAFGLGTAHNAHAVEVAFADNEITNFRIAVTGGAAQIIDGTSDTESIALFPPFPVEF